VLDVCRQREQPTDLFRAENDGETARLAHRHDRVGKIAALQRDLEEESQGSGTDIDGRIAEVAQQRKGRVELSNLTGDQLRFRQPNEVAHYYRFQQILAGRYYDRDDDLGPNPSGPELKVDWHAVHDIHDDPARGPEAPPDGLKALLQAFDETYRDLLQYVHRGFSGEAAALCGASAIMHDLSTQCVGLMRIDIGEGKTCGPPFFYVEAV
jgi:hypothetical protein